LRTACREQQKLGFRSHFVVEEHRANLLTHRIPAGFTGADNGVPELL
jgi:hypothetical protein